MSLIYIKAAILDISYLRGMDGFIKNRVLHYSAPVPRYTSYPPATQFHAGIAAPQLCVWLGRVSGGLSLYIHIPFCWQLCHYCGCNMKVIHNYKAVHDYTALLLAEAALLAQQLPPAVQVEHVHFGGGSPSILEADDFTALMQGLKTRLPFAPDATIDIEADPRRADAARIEAYAAAGVKRLSLGVQDFNDDVLKLVNRPQPYALTAEVMQHCHAHNIAVNFDLMYGLPAQTAASVENTLHRAAALAPDRIAFFGYAHVPWMKKHMAVLPADKMPDASARYDMAMTGVDILTAAGYDAIGIDHFCLPHDTLAQAARTGSLRRNFQGYTADRCTQLAGLGVSSISGLPQGYAQNTADFRAYAEAVNNGQLPAVRGYALQPEDTLYADTIEQLMCNLTVDLAAIAGRHGTTPYVFMHALELMAPYMADGLATLHNWRVTIKPEARLITRSICRLFDRHAQENTAPRHAQAV